MNYKIIQNESLFKQFIDWLPDTQKNETYYFCLFARKKYDSVLKADKGQLKRGISQKDWLFDKIKQLECEVGSYKSDGIAVSQESLALYISVNPNDMFIAFEEANIEFTRLKRKKNIEINTHSLLLNNIQQSVTRKVYMDLDFDHVEVDQIKELLKDKINDESLTFVKTRGGFHLLIKMSDIDKQYSKTWYNSVISLPGLDKKSGKGKDVNKLLPVPGCVQGDFIPYFM